MPNQHTKDLAREFFGKFSFRGIIGTSIVYLSFFFLFLLMFRPIPKGNETIVNVSVGFIVGVGVAAVVSYFFGSSKDKSDTDKAQNVTEIIKAGAADVIPPNQDGA